MQEEGESGFQVQESVLTVIDTFGKTPLHVLCENNADPNLLRVILESSRQHNDNNPCAPPISSLICAKDSRGSTPLHYLAYSRSCPFSTLKLMMDFCEPNQEKGTSFDPTIFTDVDGDTPLHWALDGYMSPRRINQLVRYSKKALQIENSSGRRPFDQFVGNFVDSDWQLHDLCGREAWENIQAYLKALTENFGKEDGSEWLPLHMIASSSVEFPTVFIDMALHYGKDDLAKEDAMGNLPLHLACAKGYDNGESCDVSIAISMLTTYPQAAHKATRASKRLPLHLAVASKKPLPLIAALLKAYPSSLNIKDPRTGLWPFLLAGVENESSIDSTFCLLRADPSIIQIAIRALISKSGQRAAQARRYMGEYGEQASRRIRTGDRTYG